MKRFIIAFTCFVVPIIIIGIVAEFCLRKLPNSYKLKYEWMQEHSNDVETLVFGSSHTYYGFQPKYYEGNAFNLANSAQLIEQDLFLLKYWSDSYSKLKTVIYPISYFTLFYPDLLSGKASLTGRYYKIYMDCDLYPSFSFYYNFEIAEPRSAFAKIRRFLQGTNKTDWLCDEYGNEAFNMISNRGADWVKSDRQTAQDEYAETWAHIPQNYCKLEQIVKLCKERGIRLVLITTPCWHSYYDNLNDNQLNKIYSIIHELQQKYDLPYFNYLKDNRFTEEDFFNGSHLSDVGEKKFTKILNKDIVSLEKGYRDASPICP